MPIIVNGVTIPTNGDYIKIVQGGAVKNIDKVIVKKGASETVVWEKVKNIILFPNNLESIDYTWWYSTDKMKLEEDDGDYHYEEITHIGDINMDIYGRTDRTGSDLADNRSTGFWNAVRNNCPDKVIFIEGHTGGRLTVDAAFQFNYDLSPFKRMHIVGYSVYGSSAFSHTSCPMPIYIGIYTLDRQTLFETTPNKKNWDSTDIEDYNDDDEPEGEYGIFDKYIDISNFTGINDIRVGVHCNIGTDTWASTQMVIKAIEFLQ